MRATGSLEANGPEHVHEDARSFVFGGNQLPHHAGVSLRIWKTGQSRRAEQRRHPVGTRPRTRHAVRPTRYDSPPTQRRYAHLATTSQAGLRRVLAARRSLTRVTVSLGSSHSEFVSPRSGRTHHESHAAVPPFQDAFHND
jgi:hypothetical protein